MEIKEVILNEEKELIKKFLAVYDLKYSSDITKTFYIEDNNYIIGTISCSDYIIKDLAIDEKYQGENIASLLINEIIRYFNQNNIYSYHVYTKPKYQSIFESLGFKTIVQTDKVIMLEGGVVSIDEEINKIKTILEIKFAPLNDSSDLVAIVMNANPITNGHVYLIEEAAKRHQMVVVFVVEEDKSEFSLKERITLSYLATSRISNVCIVPSTKYIVSSLTFPDYFLKSETEKIEENAKIDALIFKNYFMKKLHIKKRYVGSEVKSKMIIYNNQLKNILKDSLVEIERATEDNCIISASLVRELIKDGKLDEVIKFIPRECILVFSGIVREKYELQ